MAIRKLDQNVLSLVHVHWVGILHSYSMDRPIIHYHFAFYYISDFKGRIFWPIERQSEDKILTVYHMYIYQ